MKTCRTCGLDKDESEFYLDRGAPAYQCKSCCKSRTKADAKARNGGRRQHLWAKYRIRPEDYDRMFAEQGGCCAICGTDKRKLLIDHDHYSGSVRGLLCAVCNTRLSILEHPDNDWLDRACDYLGL